MIDYVLKHLTVHRYNEESIIAVLVEKSSALEGFVVGFLHFQVNDRHAVLECAQTFMRHNWRIGVAPVGGLHSGRQHDFRQLFIALPHRRRIFADRSASGGRSQSNKKPTGVVIKLLMWPVRIAQSLFFLALTSKQ